MASRYTTTLKIPEGFPDMLKEFSREVLRHQPVNIYEFGTRYFTKLAAGGDTPVEVDTREMSVEELKEYLLNLFIDNDPKHNGYVDYKTFSRVMRQHARLNMTARQIIAVMGEANETDKGVVEYPPFVEAVAPLLHKMYAAEVHNAEAEEAEENDPRHVQYVHGYLRDELEAELSAALSASDAEKEGKCTRIELRKYLRISPLGLTRRETNVLLAELHEDIHGKFNIDEFVSSAYDLLVMTFLEECKSKQKTSKGWEQFFYGLCRDADAQDTGLLPHSALREVISGADLGLSNLQVYAIMSEAVEDTRLNVNYHDFCPILGKICYSLFSTHVAKQRNAAIKNIALSKSDQYVHGMDRDVFSGRLRAALSENDKQGRGVMNRAEVRSCLDTAGLELSPPEVNALMSCLDEDQHGNVIYQQLLPLAFNIMVHLARLELVREIAQET